MADEPPEKQPDQTDKEQAPKRPDGLPEEYPPDFEWHLRAHPVGVVSKVVPPPPALPPAAVKPPAPSADAAAKPSEPAAPVAATPEKPAGPPASTTPEKPAAPAGGAAPPKPPAAAGATPPKPPAPPKEAPPKPEPLDNELVKRFRARFGEAIREAWLDRKQAILVVAPEKLREIALYARDEEKFDMLTDLTAVDWLKREKRFDVILNLYSFPKNERLRLKSPLGDAEKVPSVASVWGTADWLERECYDMFGIFFDGHPNLRRILLPDEWQGHPLRKDYDILTQDTAWIRENLGIESGQ